MGLPIQTPPINGPGAPPRAMADAVSGREPTPDNPVQGSAEQRKQQAGITEADEKLFLEVKRHYTEMWSLPRRINVRNTLERLEYVKGNQYISFDPYSFSFYDPFEGGGDASVLGFNDQMAGDDVYSYVNNIIQWLLRVFVATLGSVMPATRFSPSDASSDLDNRTADNASKANALIERQNNAKRMLKQRLCYLGVGGVYFRHTRYVRDSRICGTEREPKYGMQDTQMWDNHYMCPGCGGDTPATQAQMGGMTCQQCGSALSSGNFHPALSMPMPVVTGYEDVPKGQVRQTIYTNLHVTIAPWDSESGEDCIKNTPMLNLGVEIDQAALRAMFPDDWDAVDGGGESAGAPEGELDRMARLRAYIPGLTRGSSLMTSGQLPTYDRTWLQPMAYNCLDRKEDAERLREIAPDGCVIATVNGKWLGFRKASLTDEWTMCTTGITPGPNPPAVLDAAMPFQDRINDTANSVHEYFDRLASPVLLYSSRMISKELNGRRLPPGGMLPVPLGSNGAKLQDAIFQPQFHIDPGWNGYLQMLMLTAQLLTGVTPQMYGGHQEGIDTASGQQQALEVATGIMRLYWDQVREEDAEAAKLAVRCLAENATDDLFNVVEGDTGPDSYKNDPIEIANLKGEFNSFPDEEQGYPTSFEETREMLSKIIEASAKNELVQELFQPMSNRRYFAKYLAPGLEIPGTKERYKVLRDIGKLMTSVPVMGIDPTLMKPTVLPSVLPDYDFDDLSISQEVVREFAESNHELEQERPKQFQNLRLYYKLCVRFAKQKQMEAQMPMLPPGLGGPPLAAGGPHPAPKPALPAPAPGGPAA